MLRERSERTQRSGVSVAALEEHEVAKVATQATIRYQARTAESGSTRFEYGLGRLGYLVIV